MRDHKELDRYLEHEDELLARLASVRKMLHGLIRHYRSPNPANA
jgi:hypothetical protein